MTEFNTALQMAELVCGKVRTLPLPLERKRTLLSDCIGAFQAIKERNFAVALFNINVLVDKVNTLRDKGRLCNSGPLMADIHALQQFLLKLPLHQEGVQGPPGPPGPTGPPGPISPCHPKLIVHKSMATG
jgi:hypothetical protein